MRTRIFPGDVFLTKNPMALGRIINWVQKFWSPDNTSDYSHAGIIVAENGRTFEALWTIRYGHLSEHRGNRIAVFRYNRMTVGCFGKGMAGVIKHNRQWYPAHRLPLMIIPPVGKYLSLGLVVCSELVGKFLRACGLPIYWKGLNPDGLHDYLKNHRDFQLIYEGDVEELLKTYKGEPK